MRDAEIRVLLVDDEPLVRRSLEKTLSRAGYAVTTGENCNTGLALFQQAQQSGQPFQLAVLDINMPDFDDIPTNGAGLLLLARLMDLNPNLLSVMLTAYDDVGKAREAVGLGAQGYFVKGREQGLLELLEEILATN